MDGGLPVARLYRRLSDHSEGYLVSIPRKVPLKIIPKTMRRAALFGVELFWRPSQTLHFLYLNENRIGKWTISNDVTNEVHAAGLSKPSLS